MVDWGELRRTTPIARSFGFDRGHPVDVDDPDFQLIVTLRAVA